MNKEPSNQRKKIIQAVYDGLMDVSCVTQEEIEWLEQYIIDSIITKMLNEGVNAYE